MLRHVVYKRNEKDFATRVVEDDVTGAVTQYIGDAVAVTATTNLTGGIELSVAGETHSIESPLSDLAITSRSSAAEVLTPDGYRAVPAGAVKRERITAAAPERIESVSNDYYPIDKAEASGFVFCRDAATGKKLFRYDGKSFAQIGDFSTDFIIQIAKETASGAWVVVTHSTGSAQAGVKVYRSVNQGASWSLATTLAGAWGVSPSETAWAKGNALMFGEYFVNTGGRYPRLWYSQDDGVTWIAYTTTTRNGGHTHWIDDIDGTPEGGWIVSYGDGAYSGIIKLTYSGAAFAETAAITDAETHCVKKLNSGRWIRSEYGIAAYDPVNMCASTKFSVMDDSASGKFPYGNRSYGFRSVFEHRGILYACFTGYATAKPANGLFASADDGETWVCVYRNNAASFAGIRCGFGLGDYVYLQPQATAGTDNFLRIKALTASVVDSIRSDQPVRNRIATSALSNFTNADGSVAPITTATGGWGTDVSYENPANGAPALIEVVPGGFDGSGHCLHFVTKASGITGQNNIVSSPALSVLCAGNIPVAGDYFVATAKFKAPNFTNYNLQFLMRGCPAGDYGFRIFSSAGSEWMTLVVYGKWIAAPTSVDRLWVRVDNPSADAATNVAIDCYLDAVKLYVSKTPMWVVENRNGAVGQPVSTDVVSVPLGRSSAGAVLFQMTNSGAIEQPDGVIASLSCAGNKKLTLSYTAGRYVLSDGTTSAQTSVRSRSVADVVQVCINFGTEATLTLNDSAGVVEIVGAGSGIKCTLPSCLNLGGDVQAGSFTAGSFFGVTAATRNISESEVLSVWKSSL